MYCLSLDSSWHLPWNTQGGFGMDEIREVLCANIQRSIAIAKHKPCLLAGWYMDTGSLEIGWSETKPKWVKKNLFASQLYECMDWYWAIEQSKTFKL